MKIGYFQFAVRYGDKEANFSRVEQAMAGADLDLLVLPELFSTGYIFRSPDEAYALAEPVPEGETTRRMIRWAEERQAFIAGGLLEIEGDRLFSTVVVAGPAGVVARYRKIHPSLSERLFTPGEALSSFDLHGVPIGLAICSDGAMEDIHRRYRQHKVALILHPANFCGQDIPAAVERWVSRYGTPVLTVNRLGFDVANAFGIRFVGGSRLLEAGGVTRIGSDEREELRVFEFSDRRG
ncbi:nitrilase-related carbon-nitrogen hydrolase [Endothiovibrio diazotrophicus]